MTSFFCYEACEQLNRNGCDCHGKIFQLIGLYWTLAFEDFSGEDRETKYSKRKLDILVDIFSRWEMMEIESRGTVALVKVSMDAVLGDIHERYMALIIEHNAIVGDPLPNFFVRNEVETAHFNELWQKLRAVRFERTKGRFTMLARAIAQKNSMENSGQLVGAKWHKSASGILELISKKCHEKLHITGCSASAHLPRLE